MGLDIRWPIGLMFSLIGAMLTITGLITNSNAEMYQRSLGKNVDLWWGLVLVVFGAVMLIMAMKGSKPATGSQPESGQKPGQPGNSPQN